MITKSRFLLIAATVLTVLVFSAMWTVPAFADDSTPPPTETPTEVIPPIEEENVEAPLAEPEISSTESAVIEDEATAVEEETAPMEPVALNEVLEQLPEGTEIQVVDENGESLPLATQEAADAVISGDPIWCPVGVAPKSGVGGCSASYNSLQSLINDLKTAGGSITDPAKAGVIWIEGSYNSSNPINDPGVTSFVIDGNDFLNMDNFALTIKGGWVGGVTGSTVINQKTPSVFTGASLSIINWKGNVTISDIVIDGATTNITNSGNDVAALWVETTMNIQLDRVTVKNTNSGGDAMNGANLNNASSVKASTVIVNNSVFENNEGTGLYIDSAGVVTITTLFANGNDLSGTIIDNTHAATDKAVTLKGSLEFHNNANAGLTVNSKGLITLSNIVASDNEDNGVNLSNIGSLTNQGITIGGTNYFASNADGLYVRTHGVFTANNITAINNGGLGAYLDNCDVTLPTGHCLARIPKALKLTGYNYFNDNNRNGLEIYSLGAITVSNLTATGNQCTSCGSIINAGVIIDNQKPNTAPVQVDSVGTIVLTGYGIFGDNIGHGLYAKSHGNITLTNLNAYKNSLNGVHVDVDKTIGIANVAITGLNYFTNNGVDGLHVESDGKITISNITSNYNISGDGADLKTTDVGYGVALSGINTFMDNGATGLLVNATGVITASNVTSSYNQTGASLNNQFNTLKRYNVGLTGTNSFMGNDMDGLLIDSYGAITINNLSASWNGLISGNGAKLDNCNFDTLASACLATVASPVTLTGYIKTSHNVNTGLDVESLGAVTLNNVASDGNTGVGVYIKNRYNPTFNKQVVRGVTIKGTNMFNGNKSTGLVVLSYGAITLTNINAHYNGDDTPGTTSGVYLNNEIDTGVIAKNITITGVNSFIGNYLWGLEFHSSGVAALTRISANLNDVGPANGITPPNDNKIGGGIKGTARTITLTCGHVFGNGFEDPGVGYNLVATGVLTIKGIYSGGNGGTTDIGTGSSVSITKTCALP